MLKEKSKKLAIIVSHPIQYFVPFYRALAADPNIDLVVIYASKMGVEPYFDELMNVEISWDMDLLGGYEHVFLPEANEITSSSSFSVNNPSVSAELSRIKPDAVLVHGYHQLTIIRTLWWCRQNDTPVLMLSDSNLKIQKSWVRKNLKKIWARLLFKQFACFLVVGDSNREYFRYFGIEDRYLFRCPMTISEIAYRDVLVNRTQIGEEKRRALGISAEEIVVLTVGKIYELKRPRDILEVAKALQASPLKGKAVTFLLAGNGELMDELQAATSKLNLPVKFLGFVNLDELPKVYAMADMLLHPATNESYGLVLKEAACVGLPLIVNERVGAVGSTDIARPSENTITFSPGDIEAITKAIRRVAEDKSLRIQMGESSLKIFKELDTECSVDGVVRALDYCFRNTVDTKSGE